MSVKSIEASYRAEEKKRAELGGKVSIIETQLRNIWPDAYLMPRDIYKFHLSTTKSELGTLIRAIEDEIRRIEC